MIVAKEFLDYGNNSFISLKNKTNSKRYLFYLAVNHKRSTRYIATEYEIEGLFQFDNGTIVCRKDANIMNQRLKFVLGEY